MRCCTYFDSQRLQSESCLNWVKIASVSSDIPVYLYTRQQNEVTQHKLQLSVQFHKPHSLRHLHRKLGKRKPLPMV